MKWCTLGYDRSSDYQLKITRESRQINTLLQTPEDCQHLWRSGNKNPLEHLQNPIKTSSLVDPRSSVPAAKERLSQERVHGARTAAVLGQWWYTEPPRICPWQFLVSDFFVSNFKFPCFCVLFKPAIYMVSTLLEGLISYLSLGTRVQLVKVSVEREMWLPKLVMHQTVMAGNCLKKIHFVMN